MSSTGSLHDSMHWLAGPALVGTQTAVSSCMLMPNELTSAVISFRETIVADRGIATSRVDVGAHTPLVSSIGAMSGWLIETARRNETLKMERSTSRKVLGPPRPTFTTSSHASHVRTILPAASRPSTHRDGEPPGRYARRISALFRTARRASLDVGSGILVGPSSLIGVPAVDAGPGEYRAMTDPALATASSRGSGRLQPAATATTLSADRAKKRSPMMIPFPQDRA